MESPLCIGVHVCGVISSFSGAASHVVAVVFGKNNDLAVWHHEVGHAPLSKLKHVSGVSKHREML